MARPSLLRPLLRLTRPQSFAAATPTCRNAAVGRVVAARSFATDKDKEGERQDFKGQLWGSTTQRVAREQAQEEQYARAREKYDRKRDDELYGSQPAGGVRGQLPTILGLFFVAGAAYVLGKSRNPGPSDKSTIPLKNIEEPQHDTSTKNMQAAWVDMRVIVGKENVSTESGDLDSHSGSSWSSHPTSDSDRPFMVVRPASTEEVSQVMKVCHKRRIPVTGYSGGTSLEGHFAATRGGICVDFSRMDQIIALHKDDLDVVVQPALGWEMLNDELSEHGLFFPPDPGPGAQIGGMIGTGCSGTNAYRYGTMRDWVISLTVVLADGTIIKTRQRPRKSSAGYDLSKMFIGSEGTLGLVTEATLKVTSLPRNSRVAVCTFPSVFEATSCVSKVVTNGVPIAAVELLDDMQMKCVNSAGHTSKKWTEAPTLFFKFSGTQTAVKESISIVQKIAKQEGSKSFEFARNEEEAEELWSARKQALWSVMAQKRDESDSVWTTDVAVPMSALPKIVAETKEDLAKSGLLGTILGHVGDGNFHAIILYNKSERDTAEGVVHRMVKRALELEGTSTGEHGVGLVKRDYLEHELGKKTVDAMRILKKAYDPLCLLNCDKVVRVQQPKAGEVAEW